MKNLAKKRWKGIVFGALIGAVNGLLGGGGGMLAVPALSAMGLNAKESHATAILVILPICLMSAVVYLANGNIELAPLLAGGSGVVVGGAIGAMLLQRLNSTFIRVFFALVMIAVGIRQMIG